MRSIRYPASFVSSVYYLRDVASRGAVRAEPDGGPTAAIESQLLQAQTRYRKGQYRAALRAYKGVHSLIYGLLNPSFPADAYLANDAVMLPVGRLIEEQVAEASLRLAETIQPGRVASAVGVPRIEEPSELARWRDVGLQRQEDIPERARDMALRGVNLLSQGHIRQAIEVLEDAYLQVEQPTSSEAREIAAAVALNMSSACILTGDNDRARQMAALASEYYEEEGDNIGRAQALHNTGIILKRAGRAREAEAVLHQAAALYDSTGREGEGSSGNRGGALPSIELDPLRFISQQDVSRLPLRWPGAASGRAQMPVLNPLEAKQQRQSWFLGVEVGGQVCKLTWTDDKRPAAVDLFRAVYEPRTAARTIRDLTWRPKRDGEILAYLTHLYAFVIPQALGDCHHALGSYHRAEEYYLQGAEYTYINGALEARALWGRLASNYVEWGDQLYKRGDVEECMSVYARVITGQGTLPNDSPLYGLDVFAGSRDAAERVIRQLAEPTEPTAIIEDPIVASPILTAWARWQHLLDGLDFYGTGFTPVLTFESLQDLARSFAQRAIQAEREYVSFQTKAEGETATRRDLVATLEMAGAEIAIREEQCKADCAARVAAQLAVLQARNRASRAEKDKLEYKEAGWREYAATLAQNCLPRHDAMSTPSWGTGGGAGGGQGSTTAGPAASLSARSEWLSYEHQLNRLSRTVMEAKELALTAKMQEVSASHRESASDLSLRMAEMRRDLAADALNAFDNEVFTAETWTRMSLLVRSIARDYQYWAIRTAKLMERAYNFETDGDLRVIKSEYPAGANAGLLGSDSLLRDVESFSYEYLVHRRSKAANLKETLSLARDYPFQFDELLRTGHITFETELGDFERRHPGFYSQRISAVEVEIVTLGPLGTLHGYLRSGSISRYRQSDGGVRVRFHLPDTKALSEYSARGDALFFRHDSRSYGLFEGHGVEGTWELALPCQTNSLDYRLITDVRLVFYYTALFCPKLRETQLQTPPHREEGLGVRVFYPRLEFPEAWQSFREDGCLDLDITSDHLPPNRTDFRADKVAVKVVTGDAASRQDLDVVLTMPERLSATIAMNADGVAAVDPADAFAEHMGGPLVGHWSIALRPRSGSPLLDNSGSFRSDLIDHVMIIIQYTSAWPV